eukprot:UC1_evm1s2008
MLTHRVGTIVELPGGLTSTDHWFRVPLDWSQHVDDQGMPPAYSSTQTVFVRELVSTRLLKSGRKLPYLMYLQGGPGYPSPNPTSPSGWQKRALKDFRILLLDQRGTGRSGQVTVQTLKGLGPEEVAARLRLMRADSIVYDAEVRKG